MDEHQQRSFFYYVRDKKGNPRVTVCLLSDGEVHARGMALCSARDCVDKKEGRRIALARARKAWGTQRDSDSINLNTPEVLDMIAGLDLVNVKTSIFTCKSEFMPILIDYEQKLIEHV